jgi:hypothetical protein
MAKSIFRMAALLACALPLYAQQNQAPAESANAALEQRLKEMEDRIIMLEGQVRMLQSAQAQASAAAAAPAATGGAAVPSMPAQPATLGGASGSASKALNPDISVIGDFIGSAGANSAPSGAPLQPFSSLQMHESEVGLQAIIDPYARGDFFVSFGEEGVDLEEGYITFTALPQSFIVKAGKMRSAFGKVNTLHNHVLPWVDRPLVTTNLVGGEDGIDDAGLSVQRIIPVPGDLFLEATGQVFRGDSGEGANPLFRASRASDVSTVAHLRGYKDITESTNLDIGLSYARGHNELGSDFLTSLYGVDATLRWKPLRRSIYHSFTARSELIWSQRQQLPFERKAFGFYTSADYQLNRRWFLGGRYDYSDRPAAQNLTDNGGSLTLTYWPSEFSQIRGQFRHTSYAEGREANEVLMQILFSLGAHGAHPF